MIAQASRGAASGLLGQLGTIARPWRLYLALVSALVILAAVVQLAPPLIVRSLVDDNLAVGRADGLLLLALLYLAAASGAQGLIFGYTYLAASVAQGVLNALRVRLFRHLQDLPMAYYDQTQIGDAISRCTADVETVDTLFSSGVSALVANLVLVISTGVAMIVLSPPLALVSALVLPNGKRLMTVMSATYTCVALAVNALGRARVASVFTHEGIVQGVVADAE